MRLPAVLGFVAAIVLGLAAGAGARLALQTPSAKGERGAAPDSVAARDSADSTLRTPGDSAAPTDSVRPRVAVAPALPPVVPRLPAAVKPGDVAKRLAADSAAADGERAREAAREAARDRLAKMFTAMEPKGAAAVLERLDDEEAARVLGAISERQAGKILEYFTPQRAAGVSRALLTGSRSTP